MAEEPEEAGRLMCLTWNTHKDVLITLFDDLLREGSLVDCTLAAEGQFIKAHKIIISACSPYLKALLSEHKEQHPIVILNETTFADLKSMLEYMYKGCVNLPKHDIHRFLEQAEHLQIRGLVHGLRTKSSPGSSSLKKNSDDDDGGSGDDRPPPRAAKKARSRKKQKGPAPKRGKKAAVEPQAVEPQAVELIGEEDVKVECPSDDGEPDADNNSEGFPHPHSSSETSNQGDSSEPIAGRSDEQEMEMEGYDSNIDNNSDERLLMELSDSSEKLTLIVLPDDYSVLNKEEEEEGIGGGEEELACPTCATKFQNRRALQRHVRRKHQDETEGGFQCARCGITFKMARSLQLHEMWECGKEPMFQCHMCDRKFHIEQYLRQHVTKHATRAARHGPESRTVCPRCSRTFKHKANLDNHLEFECGVEPRFACSHCVLKFHFKAHLNEHLLTEHTEACVSDNPAPKEEPDTGVPKYKCDLCPREFTRVGSLNYHVSRKHSGKTTGERDPLLYPYSCHVCDNRYKNSTQLCRHRRWECGKEPMFQCTQCVKKFHHRHGLKQHIRLHILNEDKNKPHMQFYCDKCGKGYKLKSSLNNHAKWECGKEPVFACTVCLVKFSHKGNLKKHILTKHIQ